MGPKTKELVTILELLINILEDDGQDNWSNWMTKARNMILDSDFSGVQKVLLAYGGMGSFNDVYLKQTNRNNDNFSQLSTKAWQLATEIKDEYEADT